MTDNPREVADTRENMGIHRTTMTLTGAWLALLPGNERFNSCRFFSPPSRIRGRDRDPGDDGIAPGKLTWSAISSALESTSCETTIVCLIQKPKNLPYAHWRIHVRAHKWRDARLAALRGVERNAREGGGVMSHVCVLRIPTSRSKEIFRPSMMWRSAGWLWARHFRCTWSRKLAPALNSILDKLWISCLVNALFCKPLRDVN